MTEEQIHRIRLQRTVPDQKGEDLHLIATHANWILLADEFVYKIKKPVHFSFMDFSTLERRKYFCEREIELNRRMEPDIYLDVLPIIQQETFFFIGKSSGTIVDYAVLMKRLDADRQMHLLLEREEVQPSHMEAIARKLADFHQAADIVQEAPDWQRLFEDFEDLQQVLPQLQDWYGQETAASIREIIGGTRNFLEQMAPTIQRRFEAGFWRDGHGDLHTGNIFLLENPVIFDCIEFNDHFRQLDILDEIAFLCMDLDFFGREDLSRVLIEHYLAHFPFEPQPEDRQLFLYYLCYRANVRLKVTALKSGKQPPSEQDRQDMQRYIDLLQQYSSAYLKGEF